MFEQQANVQAQLPIMEHFFTIQGEGFHQGW
jgi:organic radical activating enzyme